jgi:hypothetical protein
VFGFSSRLVVRKRTCAHSKKIMELVEREREAGRERSQGDGGVGRHRASFLSVNSLPLKTPRCAAA